MRKGMAPYLGFQGPTAGMTDRYPQLQDISLTPMGYGEEPFSKMVFLRNEFIS